MEVDESYWQRAPAPKLAREKSAQKKCPLSIRPKPFLFWMPKSVTLGGERSVGRPHRECVQDSVIPFPTKCQCRAVLHPFISLRQVHTSAATLNRSSNWIGLSHVPPHSRILGDMSFSVVLFGFAGHVWNKAA